MTYFFMTVFRFSFLFSFLRGNVKFRPSLVEEAEVQLASDLMANGVLHIREIEHHAVGIELASHRDDQLVVMTMAWGKRARPEASGVVVGGQLRQPIAVAGTETGPPGDHTAAA